jgi:PAS domain S-box-containing protein
MRVLVVSHDARILEAVREAADGRSNEVAVAGSERVLGRGKPFDLVVVDCAGGDPAGPITSARERDGGRGSYVLGLNIPEAALQAALDAGADDAVIAPTDQVELARRLAVAFHSAGRRAQRAEDTGRAYAAVMASAPDAIFFSDAAGNYLEVNPRACGMTGFAEEELLRMNIADLIHPEDLARKPIRFAELREGRLVVAERTLRRKNGSTFVAEVAGRMLADGRLMSIVRDVTERRAATQAVVAAGERLRAVIDASPDMIAIIEADGRLRFANSAHLRILGRPPEELVGRPATGIIHPDDHEIVQHRLSLVDDNLAAAGRVLRFLHADGHWVPMEVSARRLADVAGGSAGLVVVSRDISARVAAEEALRRANDFRERVMESASDAIYALDLDGHFTLVNRRACEITGYEADELVGTTFGRLYTPEALERNVVEFRRAAVDGQPVSRVETELIRKNGEMVAITFSLAPVFQDGIVAGIVGTAEDITERKHAEAQLRESEEHYRSLVETVLEGVYQISGDGTILEASEAAARMLGYESAEELVAVGKVARLYADPTERPARLEELQREGEHRNAEMRFRRKDGSVVTLLVNSRAVYDKNGRYLHHGGTLTDITERKLAEERLAESEERYRRLVELSPDLVSIHDGTTLLYINASGARLLGYDSPGEMTGRRVAEYIAPSSLAIFGDRQRRLRETAGVVPAQEMDFVRRDGSIVAVEAASVSTVHEGNRAVLVFARDMTGRNEAERSRLELERKLLETQKLESLGVLAGGIAHDFNNLLVAIMGNASLAMAEAPPALREYLAEIETASQRAADLARQMLAYSGKGRLVVEPVEMSTLVEEMGHLLRVSMPKKTSLQLDLGAGVPAVDADPTQIRQIVMNLVINAAEAIGDSGGLIRVSTGVMHADGPYLHGASFSSDVAEGDYVFVEVADTGTGMSEATKARIFDPFFTTKFTGRGLGLAAVLGIVRGHGGALRVDSEEGKGTAFRLLLPPASHGSRHAGQPRVTADGGEALGGTVLVVDDEESVRAIAARMLERLGFRVLQAGDGEEGVAALRSQLDDIRLVLLDLMMPRMAGEETFHRMLSLKPGLKIVMMSGYNEQEIASRFKAERPVGFIQKPFTFADLEAGVRAAVPVQSS